MAVASTGPSERAGLSEAPVTGPKTMIAHVTERPIMSPAQPPGARRSTARAMIAVTSRNVPAASVTTPRPNETPSASAFCPVPTSAAPENVARSRRAPPNAPTSWAAMYAGTSAHGKRPVAASETVTAGLMCAPDVVPKA